MKLGHAQTNFKITLGTGVFEKSCSTSKKSILDGKSAYLKKNAAQTKNRKQACERPRNQANEASLANQASS